MAHRKPTPNGGAGPPDVGERRRECDVLILCSRHMRECRRCPTLPNVDEGGRIIGMDRILQWAILCLVMSASLQAMHLSSDRQGPGHVAGIYDRAGGRDVGPCRVESFGRLLPRLHGEPGRGRRHGHLHSGGARPIGASRLLRICRGLTTRPQATHQRLQGTAGPSRAGRVPTPNRSRPRFVHIPMPTCGLARRLAPLTS